VHTQRLNTHPLKFLTSRILAQGPRVPHAFSTRVGGVSGSISSHAHFSSLNFGNPSELLSDQRDPPINIATNWQLLLTALNIPDRRLVEVHQVHGSHVYVISRGSPPPPEIEPAPKADAIITNDPAIAIAVRIADCAPILLASADGSIVAAVHAGWRGVVSGVLPAAVYAMRELANKDEARYANTSAHNLTLYAAIGPCIGPAAFEVGEEVAAEFHLAFPHHSHDIIHAPGTINIDPAMHLGDKHTNTKPHIDLKAALKIQLESLGVTHIETIPGCTFNDSANFFSYRRDATRSGRLAAVISPRSIH